jgi:glycolate oxidase iron-sulfur subunit
VSELVKDVHEFLVDLPFDPPKVGLDRVVTYQDSCHLANTQGVTRQPRELLTSIPGVKLVELPNAAMCCGGGGTYTLTEREMSLRVLETKMAAVVSTGADILATANPGCLIQLDYGSRRAGLPLRVKYVTDLLDEAYLAEERR